MSSNLVIERWIPVLYHDDHKAELSLHEVFVQTQAIRDLGGETPPVTEALYRLLLAIMDRSVLLTAEGWLQAFKSAWGDLPQGYLSRRQARFDHVTDADSPQRALASGTGHGKRLGFGMLSLAAART